MKTTFTKHFLAAILLVIAGSAAAQVSPTITYGSNNKVIFVTGDVPKTFTPTFSAPEVAPYYVKNVATGIGPILSTKYYNNHFFASIDGASNAFNGIKKIALDGTTSIIAGITGESIANGPLGVSAFITPLGIELDPTNQNLFVIDQNSAARLVKSISLSGNNLSKTEITNINNTTTSYKDANQTTVFDIFTPHDVIKINELPEYYISNRGRHTIIKYKPNETNAADLVTEVAGVYGNSATLNAPAALAIDENKNLFFVENSGKKLRKLTYDGALSQIVIPASATFLDGTADPSSSLVNCFGIAYADGKLYISDANSDHVRELTLNANKDAITKVVTIAGGKDTNKNIEGIGQDAKFHQLFKVEYHDGNLYLSDKLANAFKRLNLGRYELDGPALPTGITFNERFGTFDGNATSVVPPTDYTITAYNGKNQVISSVNIKLEVSTSLPVTLTSFQAKKQTNGVNITWATSAESKNNRFELFKSTDGKNFSLISNKPSLGNQGGNYSFIDVNPTSGSNYYKLVQIDNDGTTKELGLQVVKGGLMVASWSVFPNPSKGNNVTVKYSGNTSKQTANIYDVTGRLVHSQTVTLKGETTLNFKPALAKGIYTLTLGSLGVQKIVVE